MKSNIKLTGLFILFFTFSCKKNEISSSQHFDINQFPLTVGNYWRYHHMGGYDSDDTVVINVDSMVIIPSGQRYFCSARSPSFLYGIIILTKTANQINVTGAQPNFNFLGDMTMTFPIRQEDKWTGISSIDSFKVSYADSTGSAQREYYHDYVIVRHYNSDTAVFSSSYFISPNIGFYHIGIDEQYTNSLPNKVDLYLLDYRIQ